MHLAHEHWKSAYFCRGIIAAPTMYKLIILIEAQENTTAFNRRWPEFLALAELMPGLIREVTSRVDRVLHGERAVEMLHELYFDSLKAATEAMHSPEGERAGQLLQEITAGKVTLILADHSQDELSNIRRHQAIDPDQPPGDRA
jgi:uncharacterized protein (TIGR02118 family)